MQLKKNFTLKVLQLFIVTTKSMLANSEFVIQIQNGKAIVLTKNWLILDLSTLRILLGD